MSSKPAVDPRAPRFGQGITATLALAATVLQEPFLVYVLTLLLVVPVVTRWRVDPYGFVWKRAVRRFVEPPAETESPIPHRFARVIGAAVTAVASACLLAATSTGVGAVALVGFGAAGAVGVLAAVSAVTGFCLGCRMCQQVALFRDWKLLTSPTDERGTRS